MDLIFQKNKTQPFFLWVLDNLRSNQVNPWKQLGLWIFMLSVVILMVPKFT